jgi:hypothetical protein
MTSPIEDRKALGWFACQWCRQFAGHDPRSVVAVPLVNKATGAERTLRLCPPCAFTDRSTVWRAWRPRRTAEAVSE